MLGWAGSVAIYKNNSFGVGNGPIWLDGLRCLGNELSVDTCHHERWGSTNCDHTEDLGVKCTANLLKAEVRKIIHIPVYTITHIFNI